MVSCAQQSKNLERYLAHTYDTEIELIERYDANSNLLELATLKLIISFINWGIENMNEFSILHKKINHYEA